MTAFWNSHGLFDLTRKASHRSSSQKRVEVETLNKGDALCLPSFVIITLIQRTVQRLTAGYARSSYQSLRVRRGLCVTIGLIPATARARPLACIRTRLVLMSRCA